MAEQKSIELDHVGPIEHLTIPVPDGGGVVVLHGASGVGKTHAIQAVRALHDAAARKSLRASDGMPSGKIEGLGVSVRLSRSNTARGELVCESLDSGVDPSLLVDPGIKDPLAADSKRLATLVRLAGIKISAEKWSESVGQFADDIALKDLVSDDPVATADKVRRRLHEIALKTERIQESKAAEGVALLNSIADIEFTVEADAKEQFEAAHAEIVELQQQQAASEKARKAVEAAQAELESAAALNVDIDQLHEEVKRHATLMDGAKALRQGYEKQISELRDKILQLEELALEQQTLVEIHRSKMESAEQRLGDMEHHLEQIEKLKKTVEAAIPEMPTEEKFLEAQSRRLAAIEAMKRQEVVARALTTKQKADALVDEAHQLQMLATIMRNAARSTDQVLEQALIDAGFTQIKVHDSRLCVESDRGLEPVSELSTGERWRLALDIAARSLPKGALLSVHQEGWQALDHDLRREVAVMVKERGLVIVTAEVDDGDIRAEVLQ